MRRWRPWPSAKPSPGRRSTQGWFRQALAAAGEPGRLKPHELRDGTVVLDDTYNANPASVLASVRAAREIAVARDARLVLVVGEMRELGAVSEAEHARARRGARGERGGGARRRRRRRAFTTSNAASAAGLEAIFADDAQSALELARSRVRAGDVVLVKASRGVRAERIVAGLVTPGTPWPPTIPPPAAPHGGNVS